MVSVLITSYNREEYIGEAIESVLSQSYSNFEIIITDNCSTDGTVAVIEKYLSDPRIRFCQNETNIGQFPNRNRAASLANGKYLKYLDSDDMFFPWTLEYCVNGMLANQDASLGILLLNPLGYEGELVLRPVEALTTHWLSRPILSIGPTGCIYLRSAFLSLGGFDVRYGVASDCNLNSRLAELGSVILLPKEFFFYRIHEGQELNDHDAFLPKNLAYQYDLFFTEPLMIPPGILRQIRSNFYKRYLVMLLKFFFNLEFKKMKVILLSWFALKYQKVKA